MILCELLTVWQWRESDQTGGAEENPRSKFRTNDYNGFSWNRFISAQWQHMIASIAEKN
jgi:hypothetical protein